MEKEMGPGSFFDDRTLLWAAGQNPATVLATALAAADHRSKTVDEKLGFGNNISTFQIAANSSRMMSKLARAVLR